MRSSQNLPFYALGRIDAFVFRRVFSGKQVRTSDGLSSRLVSLLTLASMVVILCVGASCGPRVWARNVAPSQRTGSTVMSACVYRSMMRRMVRSMIRP